jgi:hypothetical protein
MKSSIDLYKDYRSHSKTKRKYPSMVQRSQFKNSIEFAGSNKIIQNMYEAYKKNNK